MNNGESGTHNCRQNVVSTIKVSFSPSPFPYYVSHRSGCNRVLKFCMWFKLTNKYDFRREIIHIPSYIICLAEYLDQAFINIDDDRQ